MKRNWRRIFSDFDWHLLGVAVVLILMGVAFIWSASFDYRTFDVSSFPKKQVQWFAAALGVMLFFAFFPYKRLGKAAFLLYGLSILAILYVTLFGREIRHARRWITFGTRLSLQPSDFMKLFLILALARYLRFRRGIQKFVHILLPLLLTLIPMALIVKQPDLGTAMVFPPLLLSLLFVARTRLRILLGLTIAGSLSLPLIYFLALPYQRERIDTFLFQQRFRNTDQGYQLTHSKISVGSGGLLGKGLMQGPHNTLNFLPDRHADFIFAVIAEEWGFVGVCVLVGLYILLITMLRSIALRTREPFGRLVVIGVMTLFGFQVFLNIGMSMGLTPITGINLPLVSYGGSSLLTFAWALGIVLNIGYRRERALARGRYLRRE